MDTTVTLAGEATHDLPRGLYGSFIEHMGKCVKGGLWAPGEEADMFLGGIRQDLLGAIREVGPTLLRYPGGCFADGYHWRDGVGPPEQRPRRSNRAWRKLGPAVGPAEDNQFGTDEFMALCRKVGSEPMLTVNVGSGSPEEAAGWVEYVNGPTSSPMGSLRARHGHPEPYRVKHWFVGNEIFARYEVGHMTPEKYVGALHDFSKAMREVDESIELIGCGAYYQARSDGSDANSRKQFNRIVLEGAGDCIDYLSVHQYAPLMTAGSLIRYQFLRQHLGPSRLMYYEVLGTYADFRMFLERCIDDVAKYSPPGRRIPLAFDEWNLWFAYYSDIVCARYSLRDGLWVATILNLMHELAADIRLANIAQLVNCLGIITSTSKGTFVTPSGIVMGLYAAKAGPRYVPATVDAPRLEEARSLPIVDVSATTDGERIALFLVNRHHDEEVGVRVVARGRAGSSKGTLTLLTADAASTYNTVEDPRAVSLGEERIVRAQDMGGLATSTWRVNLPAHSLACLEIPVKVGGLPSVQSG